MDLCSPDFDGAGGDAAELRGLSLCAGYGGLDLGLHIAEPGYRTVGYVEREAHAAATLVARMDDAALGDALVWDDLKSFDGNPWRGRVHIVATGYPCQPFTFAGRRKGTADPRHLWPDVARVIDEVAPEWVFAENVEGHLSLGLADVARDLRRLGYSAKAGLFSATEVGGSHWRRRVFILAHADRLRRGAFSRSVDLQRDNQGGQGQRHHRSERRANPPAERGAVLDGGLADAARRGLDAGRFAIFAPGPGELAAWQRLLDGEPDCQPALLREDHGMADRVDRTRGAGNGVCSMAAALAWTNLKAAFVAEWEAGR